MLISARNLNNTFLFLFLYSPLIFSDSFQFNTYNNHGVIGLINTPSARFYNESSYGITIYDGTPDQKITMTSSPYDWLEASFFYTNVQDRPYGDGFDQDYKDKGFNFKLRLKEEGRFPAIAVGINDIAGTGYYSSEYIVASYGLLNLDMHLGLGWGTLNGSSSSIKNPLGYIHNSFKTRPEEFSGRGGQFEPSRYFSGDSASPFYGISYAINNYSILKIEHDTTVTPGKFEYNNSDQQTSISIDFNITNNLTIGFSRERQDYFSFRFTFKNNSNTPNSNFKFKKVERTSDDTKYSQLIKNLESNGIGVNKIIENSESVGLELTQFSHSNLDIVEEIVKSAAFVSGFKKPIKTDYVIADLRASSDIDLDTLKNSSLIYERQKTRNFNSSTKLNIRPFIASREEFFKAALLIENNNEYIFKDNLIFSSNLKYSLADNFDDLRYPPVNTFPAQVRSDIKNYLRKFDDGIKIGRAQLDYYLTVKDNNHLMFTGGILEEMFSGYGFEYLYFNSKKDYAYGFEIFSVAKRDYDMTFGTLDYKNTVGSINFYYRNHIIVPFDVKISHGEYLAGDKGSTFELSRTYLNGAKFGVFASFTDVTTEQFGEGTFDKGIFFTIPVFKNLVDYTWRPLTKDPGAKLNRKHTLHDLLVKFRPYHRKD